MPSTSAAVPMSVLLLLLFCLTTAFMLSVSDAKKDDVDIGLCLDGDQFHREEVYQCIKTWIEDYEKEVDWDRVDLKLNRAEACNDDRDEYRTADGSCNHQGNQKTVGMTGQPFTSLGVVADSNDLDLTDYSSLKNPDPLIISRVVAGAVAKKKSSFYTPSYSSLALSWLIWIMEDVYDFDQFDIEDESYSFDLPSAVFVGFPMNSTVRAPKTKYDNSSLINLRTAFLDSDTVYGADEKTRNTLRNGAKVKLNKAHIANSPVGDKRSLKNYGSAMWNTIWSREHNYLVDQLVSHYKLSEDDLYFKASLCVNAEIIKIFYQEFIPSFIGQPWALEYAQKAWVKDKFEGDIKYSTLLELLSITNWLYNPENLVLRNTDGEIVDVIDAKEALDRVLHYRNGTSEILISLAGQPTYPINLATVAGSTEDALTKDKSLCKKCYVLTDRLALAILQERENGVPRYNDIRRLLRLDPIKKFSDLTSNNHLVDALNVLYGGDVEKLDFSVGSLAEDHLEELPLPPTATYIFLYSLRRLQRTDRFFGSKISIDTLEKLIIDRFRLISLTQIIRENTEVDHIPRFPFKVWTFNSTLNYPLPPAAAPFHIRLSAFEYGYFMNLFFISIVGIWLISFLIEVFGRSFWFKFRKMALAHQRAVVSYILEIIFQIAIFAWEMYIYIYITWINSDQTFTSSAIRQAQLGIMLIVALYVWELIYRISLRGQILLHHIVVIMLCMVIIFRIENNDDSATLRLVQCFTFLAMTAVSEQPIFLALLLYRFDYKYAWLFFGSAVQNLVSKLFLHGMALYYYCAYLVHWDLFWAIFYPMIVLGALLPAQIYAIHAQYILGRRCMKKGKPVAVMAQSSGVMGKAFFPPPLLSMPSDI